MREARLEESGAGLAPAEEGWFVVGVRDTAWLASDAFGAAGIFEGFGPAGLEGYNFPQVGYTLAVLQPGRPSGLYHAESAQEDFLVLSGECLLLIEGEERPLRAWDFVHCPPGTEHILVGAGDGPCVVFMTGRRVEGNEIVYPRSETALRHGAGVEAETQSAAEAYAPYGHWRLERPPTWAGLPWR